MKTRKQISLIRLYKLASEFQQSRWKDKIDELSEKTDGKINETSDKLMKELAYLNEYLRYVTFHKDDIL